MLSSFDFSEKIKNSKVLRKKWTLTLELCSNFPIFRFCKTFLFRIEEPPVSLPNSISRHSNVSRTLLSAHTLSPSRLLKLHVSSLPRNWVFGVEETKILAMEQGTWGRRPDAHSGHKVHLFLHPRILKASGQICVSRPLRWLHETLGNWPRNGKTAKKKGLFSEKLEWLLEHWNWNW